LLCTFSGAHWARPYYDLRVTTPTWSWREQPVLEAVLRMSRQQVYATPDAIAAEAIMHLGDVDDGIYELVRAGYVETAEVPTDDGGKTTIVMLRGL
jgi:hypothetical protein